MGHSLIYITAGDAEEAKSLGRALVEARLAACANVIHEITPIFWWDGEVQDGSEAVLLAKTRDSLVGQVTAFIMERHSYACPCVVAVPIRGGNKAFLDWIDEETAEAADAAAGGSG